MSPAPALMREPLKPTGCLDTYEYIELTPVIGREYPTLQLIDLYRAKNRDELLRELAIIVSQRGVVFFRHQSDLNLDDQRGFTDRLGIMGGRPKESSLSVHPSARAGHTGLMVDKEAQFDDKCFLVSNQLVKKMYDKDVLAKSVERKKNTTASRGWHSDCHFEPVAADYSCLKMHTNPPSGGDTLWASGVEMYKRLSREDQLRFQKLTYTASQPTYKAGAIKGGFELNTVNRGHPENCGDHFTAVHPVVRTNPVTGWNSVYSVGLHVKKINGVSEAESEAILDQLLNLLVHNHDLQCRFKWTENDVAIWDNRSVFHAATPDVDDTLDRAGRRFSSIGEKAYFDPKTEEIC